jgi:hypothetical protein
MRIVLALLFSLTAAVVVSAQDPVKVDPAHYRVLFENAHMRVLEYRDKPSDKAPMHSHPVYMTYVTGAGKTKIVQPNGETNVEDTAGSEFACRPATQHATENVGNTPTQELLVEFKDAMNPCSAERAKANTSNLGQEAPAKEEITKVQDALIAAYIHRDTAALDRILADEYTFINDDAGGVVNKKQILDSFRSGGDREITSYIRQDDHVRWYGDVAVLTYRYHSNETYKGRDAGGDFRVTRIFVKRDGRWQSVGGQETRVSGSEPSASLPITKTAETGFGSDQTRKTSDIPTRLIGSWRQVSDEEMLPDGSVVQLDEIGLLTYDTSGHMSGQAMRRSEPKQQIPSDATYQSNGYDAYFGTFTVDEEKHTVTHHVEGSVARQLVGKDLARSFRFEGNRLIMKPTSADEHWTVVFEKNKTD